MAEPRFRRLTLIAGWRPELLRAARIAIIGCGTTGTEVAKNLALSGVGHLLLVDHDDVAPHNASGLFDVAFAGLPKGDAVRIALGRFAPETEVVGLRARMEDLGEAVFADCGVVVLGVDNLAARVQASASAALVGVPCVDVGVAGLSCRVQTTIPSLNESCFTCGLWPDELADLARRVSCSGRVIEDLASPLAISAPGAALGAAIAAEEVIALVLQGPSGARFAGRELRWEASSGRWIERRIPRRSECDGHERLRLPLVEARIDGSTRGRELLAAVSLSAGPPFTRLDARRSLVRGVRCGCGWSDRCVVLFGRQRESCPASGDPLVPVGLTRRVGAAVVLSTAGFPDRTVLRASRGDGDFRDIVLRSA